MTLRLASTIGPIDAGIVPALLEAYRAETGVETALTGAGTSRTLALAKGGGFDVVMVHAPALERQFIAEGYGLARHEIMANDFTVVGPAEDPAGVRGLRDVAAAFRRIANAAAPFLTRGDGSGTHVKEQEIWQAAGLTPAGSWYRVAERGVEGNAATALEASVQGFYTLLDRATVLTLRGRLTLEVLVEGDPLLLNIISAIPLNPAKIPGVDGRAAERFVSWLLSDAAQRRIADFGVAQYGQPLFYPRAPGWRAAPPLDEIRHRGDPA